MYTPPIRALTTMTISTAVASSSRLRLERHDEFNSLWWTTSGGSTFIPSAPTPPPQSSAIPPDTNSNTTPFPNPASQSPAPSGSPSSDPSSTGGVGAGSNILTSTFPVTTIADPTMTITSFSESIVTSFSSSSSTLPSSTNSISETSSGSAAFSTTTGSFETKDNPVCVGQGIDASAAGLLAAIVVPSAIGLILWLLFAILRPRFRQIYSLREWFVQQDLRPKPLGSSFFAWLFPKVPMVPDVPSDVSDAGRSTATDAHLFPSDEQLTQRALWISFLIVLGWSILGLAGALPLYLISTPCHAELPSPAVFGGGYSTLQDLSLLRLLRMFDTGNIKTTSLATVLRRAPADDPQNARVRIILLTIFTLVLGLLPALWKIIKEFNSLVAYRQRWLQTRCENKDLGWLSANKARGFTGWGEKRLKDYIIKIGLSSSLGNNGENGNNTQRIGNRRRTRRPEEEPLNRYDDPHSEVDIQSLFSICDTHQLALLIDERDEILENLEAAETRYIASFRITTPDPSIADFEPPPPPDPSRPYISRPLPLGPQPRKTRGRRAMNRAFGTSSLAPTSFVAPSSFYKLRGVRGVSGGRFADSGFQPSLSQSIQSRVIGSRFLEVNRNSVAYGRLQLGSHVVVEKSGQLGPSDSRQTSWLPQIPDPRLFGPNYGVDSYEEMQPDEHGVMHRLSEGDEEELGEEWVDLTRETPDNDFASDFNGTPPQAASQAGPSSFRRPPKEQAPSSTRRETFPLRYDDHVDPDSRLPPHLRLQPSQPFVRPLEQIDFSDLGEVYDDIRHWRSRLKAINADIADAQANRYNDIAEGSNIKGWLLVGRGLRFIPGVQLIEGRAKEDIRWDVLQNERTWLDTAVLWAMILMVVVLLAAGLTAASGLALANAPDVAHYIPFLQPLLTASPLAAGIATVLAPAVAATLFIIIALAIINWASQIHGSISISGNQLLTFKITFFVLAAVGTIWLVAVGALLFAFQAFSEGSGESKSIANGSIYMSILLLTIVINVAIIFPACLLLQPFRLWKVLKAERHAITPRQRFRAVYPRTYNPSFATSACILAIVFASTFALIFPLIGPAVVLLLLLTLIAHRYLVGYVYGRTHSQTGGVLQIWLIKRFGTLLSFQPILLGLIFLSRHFWIEGGVLVGTGVAVIIFIESYAAWKTRLPGRNSLSPITVDSLQNFGSAADSYLAEDENATVNGSSARGGRTRGSMASVLEMMSLTLAVMPSSSAYRGAVPLQTETLDDLTATERAARTHPDAPPHLPPLPFTDHAEEMAGILYAPELIAPPPIIWLPNDSAGVAHAEAVDLQKYHDLQVTLDVRSKEYVMPRRSSSVHRRSR
ncbi:hypothetical protein BDQ12DRAFT_645286 [Crucibulum laeve]|uniref:CSC1/OSCA1-like 7TM region domain-containing protein n=1 Tax=Crucibulum laeve TaxID=68775 RepID=A0A5C3MBX4_9AGAR|nr:hypothetical protein BDQ12DRAFT_645286 [Crucibulum laeve]